MLKEFWIFIRRNLVKIENQLSVTNALFKAGFCKEIWYNRKHTIYIKEAEKLRNLHSKAWSGQRRETLQKAMDIGYGVDVKEHIAVEVVIKKNMEFVINSLYKNILSKEDIVNTVEPFLSIEDVDKIDKFKDFPNSKTILNRIKEDLVVKWLEPLYLEENTDKEDIDMEKVKIVRRIVYHDTI